MTRLVRVALAVVFAAGCAKPGALENGAERSLTPPRELRLVGPETWKLRGSARRDGATTVTLKVGCVAWGEATADLGRVPDGLWNLKIDYQAECDDATSVEMSAVDARGAKRDVAEYPIYAVVPVMERCPVELQLARGEHVTLRVYALGGLECGGTITMTRAALEAAASSSWSSDRCRWLNAGLRAAMSTGDSRVIRDYLANLPPRMAVSYPPLPGFSSIR